jgi:RNA polymerase sigma factor (sigma-70 family)
MQEAELLNLFDTYSGMVYRLAFSYLRQAQDAEDAVQAVFLKMIEGKAQPIQGKERAFLTQITINYCKDALRTVWRRRVEPLDDTIAFEQKEDRELFDAVMALPDKYRIVVHLHYYEGYSFPEIAAFLEISPSAVSMRMHRARNVLKNKLREDCYELLLSTDF